jgi:hypothetical protein
MEAFVYSWSDHKTAKIYVGVHKGSQTDGYICSSKPMMAEYRERPTDFTRQIIATGTLNDCAVLEVAIIKQLLKDKGTCYNRAAGKMIINDVGPNLGKKFTVEHKKKLSDAKIGKKLTKPRKPITEETRKRLSNSHKGQIQSIEARAKNSAAQKGKTISEKQRLQISLVHRGKILSNETKQKLSNSHLGKIAWNKGIKWSEETKAKLKAAWVIRKERMKNA